MIELKIYADSADELRKTIGNMATTGQSIDALSDDAVLEHLRGRMRGKNMVVQVVPFASPVEPVESAPMTDPPKTTRTRKPKEVAAPSLVPAAEAIPMNPEAAAAQPTPAEQQPKTTGGLTRADVIAALDAYSQRSKEGQAGARKVMIDVTGTDALVKINETQWPALIEALAA